MAYVTESGGSVGAAAEVGESSLVAGGPIPKHAQLRAILLAQIGTVWPPHSAIPSERDLMAAHGLSRATVREAIRQLVEENKLTKVHGKGTFVAGSRVETSLHLASFTDDMRRRGLVPATIVREVALVEAPMEARAALGLDGAEKVWLVERLRLAGGVPMALERGYYSTQAAPDLGSHDLTGSLYSILANAYGLTVDRAEQTVWAENAESAVAEVLEVSAGAPLMVFRRTSGAGSLAVESVISWYRGDRYQVHMSLGG